MLFVFFIGVPVVAFLHTRVPITFKKVRPGRRHARVERGGPDLCHRIYTVKESCFQKRKFGLPSLRLLPAGVDLRGAGAYQLSSSWTYAFVCERACLQLFISCLCLHVQLMFEIVKTYN